MYLKEHRKVIAVDLDQTLAHTMDKLCEWHNDTYGTQLHVTDFNTYEYWKVWGGTKEESYIKIRDFYESDHFARIEPIRDFALEALKMLKRRHFTLVIVTSRQQFVAEKTKRFVDKHYPGIFESIYFCNLDLSDTEQLEYVSKPKSVICQEIGVDVLIDDSLEHAFDCSHLGIDILLYDKQGQYTWNHYKPQQFTPTLTSTSKRLYQHFADTTTKNIHRMTSWREILAQFPKPSSPLRYCCYYSPEQVDDDESTSTEEEDEEEEHPLFEPHYYNNSYETVEVEEMTDDEDYPLWNDNRVWV